MLYGLSYAFLCLFLNMWSAASSAANCVPDKAAKGKLDPESQILQYTVEYASIPQRWAAGNIHGFSTESSATQSAQKCTQMVCVACGWKPPKVQLANPESKVEGAERCLYLSTFSPYSHHLSGPEVLPMVFHVHHGQMIYGFKTELGEVKKVTQRGIAVSNANFRLGAFGFLSHPDLEQVNAGQQDLVSALTWIQRYACQVGGDPGRVTLTGSSTGASQVLMLIASTASTGLFHGAWMHSLTSIGNPGFFSQDVSDVFEKSVRPMMMKVGCGTLDCMREMNEKRLVLNLLDAHSMLVLLNNKELVRPDASPFAFDGLVIPNMLNVACSGFSTNSDLPIVVGQGKDELDTLKFQFQLEAMLQGMLKQSLTNTSFDTVERQQCIQRKVLDTQGIQETMEDVMFSLGPYSVGTKFFGQESGPRWHFLLTAPSSASKRSWHTTAELLAWSPSLSEDSMQYDHLTKDLVLRNAMPELRRYSHDNFLHFIRTRKPQDESWSQTLTSPAGDIGGLPSKLWDQKPLAGGLHWEQYHSNRTVQALHGLLCKRKTAIAGSGLDFKSCLENPAPPSPLDSFNKLRRSLSVFKKSDLLFSMELLKAR